MYRASVSRSTRNVSSLSLEKGPRDSGLFKSPYLTRCWDNGLRLFEVRFLIAIFASWIFKILRTMLTKQIFFLGSLGVGGPVGALIGPPKFLILICQDLLYLSHFLITI